MGGKRLGVDLDAYCLALAPGDGNHTHTRHLGKLLRHAGVDQIVEFGQRHGLGTYRHGQYRGISRVDLVVHRRRGQVAGQQVARSVDSRLNLLLGHVHIDVEAEAKRQHRSAA